MPSDDNILKCIHHHDSEMTPDDHSPKYIPPPQVIQSHPARDSSTARLDSVQDELVQLEVREKQLQVGENILA